MYSLTWLVALALCHGQALAQLYSSGNNYIAGSQVSIGTSNPLSRFHIYGNTGGTTDLRIQHTATHGSSRIAFFADTSTSYSLYGDYSVMNKYTAATSGLLTAGIPVKSLFAFSNSRGSLYFTSAANIGFGQWSPLSNTYVTRLFIDSSYGHVGLGTVQPRSRLHLHTPWNADTFKITHASSGALGTDGLELRLIDNQAELMNLESGGLNFGTQGTSRMQILPQGQVLIGNVTTPAGYKLYVEEGILTEKVKVAVKSSLHWADYVFDPAYRLPSLTELDQYVKKHQHLPGIPSADEVCREGVDLLAMQAKLLARIEELTLHLIQMDKELNKLKKQQQVARKTAPKNRRL